MVLVSGDRRPPGAPRWPRCPREVLPGRFIRGALIAVVRPWVGVRRVWAPLWIAWGRHSGGLTLWALQVAGACYLLTHLWHSNDITYTDL